MVEFIGTLSDLWPIIVTLIVCVSWLIHMRRTIQSHQKVLYSDHGELQVVTVPMCMANRTGCSGDLSKTMEEIKTSLKTLDDGMEERVRRLHEKREDQERAWSQQLQRINYFMGQVATKMNIPDPPEMKGPSS